MGKYEILGNYLRNRGRSNITLNFKEIENMLNFQLPNSSKKYRAWWTDDPNHVQAYDGWLKFSYKVKTVDFEKEIVNFIKIEGVKLIELKIDTESKQSFRNIAYKFEKKCKELLSNYFKINLKSGEIHGIHKLFDFVSDDKSIVGDAKYYTLVNGKSLPPAKFSVIAEHVWLLEKTKAKRKFLVFGNDKRVPEEWLKRYGNLVNGVDFYFIDFEDKKVQKLN